MVSNNVGKVERAAEQPIRPNFETTNLRVAKGVSTERTGFVSLEQAEASQNAGFGKIHKTGGPALHYVLDSVSGNKASKLAKKILMTIANLFISLGNKLGITKLTNRVLVIKRDDFQAYTKHVDHESQKVEQKALRIKEVVSSAVEEFQSAGKRRADRRAGAKEIVQNFSKKVSVKNTKAKEAKETQAKHDRNVKIAKVALGAAAVAIPLAAAYASGVTVEQVKDTLANLVAPKVDAQDLSALHHGTRTDGHVFDKPEQLNITKLQFGTRTDAISHAANTIELPTVKPVSTELPTVAVAPKMESPISFQNSYINSLVPKMKPVSTALSTVVKLPEFEAPKPSVLSTIGKTDFTVGMNKYANQTTA